MADTKGTRGLTPHLNPGTVWALSLGTSIGWGSLVITSNTYLINAGPLGSVIGLIFGALVMLVIGRNYSYLISCYPESGGAYTYLSETFGHDYGFLAAWFLLLTYFAMLWANATALPLFAHYFIGDYFKFVHLYKIFGYDVYLGEVMLSVTFILVVALICSRSRNCLSIVMVIMTMIFCVAIPVCFAVSIVNGNAHMRPNFASDTGELRQITKIACISSWAFIGFENVSHVVPEFNFRKKKIQRILYISILTSTLLYVFITLMSVTGYPSGYSSWIEYIRDLDNLSGLEALPAFYVTERYMGRPGVIMLIVALLMLILTSLVGNLVALSRLLYAMSKDGIIPNRYSAVNSNGIPGNAVMLAAIASCIVPFAGRTAIGWIVDVTTLGATLIYGFVSAASFKTARFRNDKTEKITGFFGILIMTAFAAYLLVPNLFTSGTMETESYFLFVLWSVLGFIFFRTILIKDKQKRFGQSVIVWISLLSLILFISLVWMSRATREATGQALNNIQQYYVMYGSYKDSLYVAHEIEQINKTSSRCIAVVIGVVALSLGVLLNNYSIMSRRARASEKELGEVRDFASRDPLTGVKSKHAYAKAESDIDFAIEQGSAEEMAVVICDINGLKIINDTYGHKAGDEYIKSGSRIICNIFTHSPVYRVGGDEFVVILKGQDFESRERLMSDLKAVSEGNISLGEVVIASGIAEFDPSSDRNLHSVFERADKLMYENKEELKNMGSRSRD